MADYLIAAITMLVGSVVYLGYFKKIVDGKRRIIRENILKKFTNFDVNKLKSVANYNLVKEMCRLRRKARHLDRDLENASLYYFASMGCFFFLWFTENISNGTITLIVKTSAFVFIILGIWYTILIKTRA